MSKYMEDIQGKVVSNPINETNTKYPYIEKENGVRPGDKYSIDTQYMYNDNEPVSDIDTTYYADYRNKIEELRKRTESTYEALESCLVPVEIPGMSFQPFEYVQTELDNGEVVEEKVKSFTYFFQDHLSPIGIQSDTGEGSIQEFVFRTNKVKFIDDRHRRLIYDRTIHLMSLKEDEDNKVTFREMLRNTFTEYSDKYKTHYSLIKDTNAVTVNYGDIISNILSSIADGTDSYTVIDNNGKEKKVESEADFDYPLLSGQDIDTFVPSTLYNLYNLGWVNAAMIYLNGLSIEWTKILISVDNIDTFIIITNLPKSGLDLIDDDKEIYLDYIHIPFKVQYIIGSIYDNKNPYYDKYVTNGNINKPIIFAIDKTSLSMRFTHIDSNLYRCNTGYNFDKIICVDDNIKFMEFTLYDSEDSDHLIDAGINYTKSFKQFCDNDYRCKLKQFNFLGFELNRYDDSNMNGTLKNDDFTITWHPFNIMDVRFKRLFNRSRVFKVFYNTKVLYDQDNILRIKNHDRISDEYEKYRKDVTANIETYLNEIYILAKKDIGTYISNNSTMYGYKYHYVTPYECLLLYNAISEVNGDNKVSFDDFRNINVSGIKMDPSKFKTVMNPKLVANKDGKCIWTIPVSESIKECPAVKIIDMTTGDIVLADIDYISDTNEVVITMYKDGNNIPENTYKVTMYYADMIKGNPAFTESATGIYTWSETILGNVKAVAVYETETNQVVLADVESYPRVDGKRTRVRVTLHTTGAIPADKYKLVININKVDEHSFLNYINGGFIAVPKDEDSMFAEKINEKDIYTGNVLNSNIREYFSNIIKLTGATLPDILIPIDDERRDDLTQPNDIFYNYEGDNKGKIVPYTPIANEFNLTQEYDDAQYDKLKIRFELAYLNNMEEGATPVDEFIYYFDNDNVANLDKYPVTNSYVDRQTANILNAIAKNIFKYDPNLVANSIYKMNYAADYIIPKSLGSMSREDCIVTSNEQYPVRYDYRYDPKFYYNYGYRTEDNKPHRLQSEWGLRRNLPEMFYWSLDEKEYTIDSMHLLDEVFNFTYDFNKTYEENLKEGLNYVIGYDADKIEQSIKRSIVSITRTGAELKKIQASHPYVRITSLNKNKVMTFIKNKNRKILFDNIKFIVTLNSSYGDIVDVNSFEFIDEKGTRNFVSQNVSINMKYGDQVNPTITKASGVFAFKDVDKNFTQTYDKVKYNRTTEMIEFYYNDELVITTQVDEVHDNSKIELSRWNISRQENYVMIFKNRELYDRYHSIEYTDISFIVDFNKDQIVDKDEFEFVFFLNANNTIMKKLCETNDDLKLSVPSGYFSNSVNKIRTDDYGNLMDKGLYEGLTGTVDLDCAIACDTSIIDAENVQLLVNVMPVNKDDKWTVDSVENTAYELSYKMKSYKAETSMAYNNEKFIMHLEDDNKLNGLHRVTKQGGGEYFLVFDGTVPKNDGTTDGGVHVKPGGGGGTSGITGIGLMAFATQNVRSIDFNGTIEEWNKISKTLPWIRDATNLNNGGGIKCTDGNVKVKAEETQNGSV